MAKYGTFKYGYAKYGDGDILWIDTRSQYDLDNNTSLAYVNYWDLNRIETRIGEISDILGLDLEVRTNWEYQTQDNVSNIPLSSDLQRIQSNLDTIFAAISDKLYFGNVSTSFSNLNYEKLNTIEKSLYRIHKVLKEDEVYA